MSSSSTAPTRITVLISGNGSNLQALIDSISQNTLDAQIIRVISNRKTAYGLTRASQAGIPTLYHNLLAYKKKHPATEEGIQAARLEYDTELARLILADEPELVVCLGFMHIVSKGFLDPIQERGVRVINLHPALPGQFNGVVSVHFSLCMGLNFVTTFRRFIRLIVCFLFLWDTARYRTSSRSLESRTDHQDRRHDTRRHCRS